jgi:hypothetical protein
MEKKFKYQINHFSSIQPQHISLDDLAIRLRDEHNIPPHLFDRDRRLRDGESTEIPEERLRIYAHLLNVSVQALVEEREESYA